MDFQSKKTWILIEMNPFNVECLMMSHIYENLNMSLICDLNCKCALFFSCHSLWLMKIDKGNAVPPHLSTLACDRIWVGIVYGFHLRDIFYKNPSWYHFHYINNIISIYFYLESVDDIWKILCPAVFCLDIKIPLHMVYISFTQGILKQIDRKITNK